MKELDLIVQKHGIDAVRAKTLLEKFSGFFEKISEWEDKAFDIIVTDESQTADIEIAEVGRKAIKKIRCDVENSRKDQKEGVVREGKAIDGMANVLKFCIAPIEEHLDKQSNFVKYKKQEADAEILRLAKEKIAKDKEDKIEADRLVKVAEENRIRQENARLKAEKKAAKEEADFIRKEAEEELAEERARAKVEADRIAQENAVKLAEEKKKAKVEADRLAHENEIRLEEEGKKADAIAKENAENLKIEIEKAEALRIEREKKIAEEREKTEKENAEKAKVEKARFEAEQKKSKEMMDKKRKLAEEKAKAEKEELERKHAKEMEKLLIVICPKCGHEFKREQ